jgi:hypothetical protein
LVGLLFEVLENDGGLEVFRSSGTHRVSPVPSGIGLRFAV